MPPFIPSLWSTLSHIFTIYRRVSLSINGHDLLRQFRLREFQLLPSPSPIMLSPRFHDQSMSVPHRSTAMPHFRSSGFRSFKLLHSLPPEVILPGIRDLLMHVLLDPKTSIHFGSSYLGSFKLLRTHSSQCSFTRRQRISTTHSSGSDGLGIL
jgi:hypothetical protein